MARYVRVPVKPEIWNWALKESQKEKNEFLNRFPKAEEWLSQELHPTFKQLEDVANFFHVPFGYMFLETPPKEDVIHAEFRSISNKMPEISKNLQDTILEMDHRRSWMADYRENIGWSKLEIITTFKNEQTGDPAKDAQLAKTLLNLTDDWQSQIRDLNEAFRVLKEKLEAVGILVMRNGIVGNNTHRSLVVQEFRAFMLFDDLAPLIFINNNDSKAGKVFSLIHEYFHILFEQENVFIDILAETSPTETEINNLTAEFLMPTDKLTTLWINGLDVFEQIDKLSKHFKVSKLALAIKLNSLGFISSEVLDEIKKEYIRNFQVKEKRSGGDYYRNYHSRISTVFAETVIRSAESGEIAYTDAFRLLGVRGETYDSIKAKLMPYG